MVLRSNPRRVHLTPGYILHHHPFRDTSRILEVFTRDYGRLSLFARGIRGPKAKLAALAQPFKPLLLSWVGKGEAPQLIGAETGGQFLPPMPPSALMAGFYINELILKLTTRHDPLPMLYEHYHEAIVQLVHHEPLEPVLRIFEKRLLDALGYGPDLTGEFQSGRGIEPHAHYDFRPMQGLFQTVADAPGAIEGASLIALLNEELASERALEDARRLLQAALAQCLEGRELNTRAVARAVARRDPPGARKEPHP